MVSDNVIIINKLGLHTRAAAQMVTLANTFCCEIKIQHKELTANANSILSLMMLGAAQGNALHISCDGKDEVIALQAITSLIGSHFGELE